MWRGDVSQALATVAEADALTADFVSMAAAAGHQAWAGASRLYACKLEQRGAPSPKLGPVADLGRGIQAQPAPATALQALLAVSLPCISPALLGAVRVLAADCPHLGMRACCTWSGFDSITGRI